MTLLAMSIADLVIAGAGVIALGVIASELRKLRRLIFLVACELRLR